jgi:hypothetical protein
VLFPRSNLGQARLHPQVSLGWASTLTAATTMMVTVTQLIALTMAAMAKVTAMTMAAFSATRRRKSESSGSCSR